MYLFVGVNSSFRCCFNLIRAEDEVEQGRLEGRHRGRHFGECAQNLKVVDFVVQSDKYKSLSVLSGSTFTNCGTDFFKIVLE